MQYLLLVLAVFSVYSVSLSAPFVWDDEVMIEKNVLIRSWDNVGRVFTSSAFGESFSSDKFYRPLQIMSYIFDYSLYGLNPTGFRLTSVVLHCISSLLFFCILIRLLPSRTWAFVMALFFAIHPIHIESVTYLSGRGDTVYLLCLMVSFLSFLKRDDAQWGSVWCCVSGVSFLAALFTKENGFTFPLTLALFYLVFKNGKPKTAWSIIGVQCASALGYFLWRNPFSGEGNTVLSDIAYASFWERLYTGPYILLTYIKLLVFPYPLHMEYLNVETTFLNIWLIILVLLSLALWYYWRTEVYQARFILGVGWFLIALAPVSQILMPLASTVREHWLTFPSMGLFIWAGLVASDKLPVPGKRSWVLILCSVVAISGVTIQRNLDWKDPMRLYLHDLSHEPNSFVLLNNVGVIAFRNGDMATAREYFLKAINVSPGNRYGTAHNNYGAVVEREGNVSLAAYHYRQSVEMSHYELGYVNLGRLLLRAKNTKDVIPLLEDGVSRFKNNVDMVYLLAGAYYMSENFGLSKQYYQNVQRLSPGFLATDTMLQRIKEKGF